MLTSSLNLLLDLSPNVEPFSDGLFEGDFHFAFLDTILSGIENTDGTAFFVNWGRSDV